MAKQIVYGDASTEGILRGVNSLANAVKVTRPARAERDPRQEVRVAHHHQGRRHGGEGDRAKGCAREHGHADGEGSDEQDVGRRRRRHHDATVLAQAIYREGAKNVTAGGNPMAVKRGSDKAVDAITTELERMSNPVTPAYLLRRARDVLKRAVGRSSPRAVGDEIIFVFVVLKR